MARIIGAGLGWIGAVFTALGCVVTDPLAESSAGLADGAECSADDECRSGICLHSRLCGPSRCDCPGRDCSPGGEASSDCDDGSLCVYYESVFESLGEIFNVEHDMNGGYCRPLCEAGCPEHFVCAGTFCEPDRDWAAPVPTVTWSGAASGTLSGRSRTMSVEVEYGQPITIMGSASSPIGQTVTLRWMLAGGSTGEQSVDGERVEVMVEPDYYYRRVELIATDEESRSSLVSVVFEGCLGSGETCGYQGSGCCRGCDRNANQCM